MSVNHADRLQQGKLVKGSWRAPLNILRTDLLEEFAGLDAGVFHPRHAVAKIRVRISSKSVHPDDRTLDLGGVAG